MSWLSELVGAVGGAVTAEMRLMRLELQKAVVRAMSVMMTVWMACVLLLLAVGMLIASAFIAICSALGPAIAALLTGAALLVLSAAAFAVARAVRKKP